MADTTATATPAAGNSGDFMKQLAAALAAVAGGVGGRAIANSQGNPLTSAVPPQLSQLLDITTQRQAYQNPLFQATTQGAYDMLPDFAKKGTALSGTLSNVVPAAPAGGSGGVGLGTVAGVGGLGALAGMLANNGSGGAFDLSKIFEAIKKKFGGQPPGVQGNKPNQGGALQSGNPGSNGFTGWDPSVSDPSGNPFLPSDPGFYVGGGEPVDPSGGSGIGPGMQAYYDWLAQQGGDNVAGGAGSDGPTGTNWWEE